MLDELVFLVCHIRKSHRISTCSHRIRIVFSYSEISYCKILQPYVAGYGADAFRCGIIVHWCSSNESSHKKIIVNNKWSTFASARFGGQIHVNQPLQLSETSWNFQQRPKTHSFSFGRTRRNGLYTWDNANFSAWALLFFSSNVVSAKMIMHNIFRVREQVIINGRSRLTYKWEVTLR